MGSLKCVGTSQHLKTKYGSGYQIDISVGEEMNITSVRSFFANNIPDSLEIECFGSNIKYSVQTSKGGFLSYLFKLLESNKENLGIRNYSVGQTTLEQIFLQFAKRGDHLLQTIEDNLLAKKQN